jgi:kynurenine formamidase
MTVFIDLSHEIHHGMVTYPGLPAAAISTVMSREESRSRYAPGVEFHIGSATLCTNTGTYLDTPAHRYEDGWDLTGLPLDRCADLPAVLIDVPAGEEARPFGFTAAHFEGRDLAGTAVLLRTGWSERWGTAAYAGNDHPFLSASGTDALVSAGVTLVGIDSLNIDSTVGGERPAHSGLLAAGIPIVEHLTGLDALPTSGARFFAVPIKVAGLGTFAVRAFATIADAPTVEDLA